MAAATHSVALSVRWKDGSSGAESWTSLSKYHGRTTDRFDRCQTSINAVSRSYQRQRSNAVFSRKRNSLSCSASEHKSNAEVQDGENMEEFLGSLSLEYDSVWDTKPAWCQPWTILLTGTTIVGGSWQLLHIPILTVLAGMAIGAWWFIFLVAYPKSYKTMIEERRERMRQGKLDTYGSNISD